MDLNRTSGSTVSLTPRLASEAPLACRPLAQAAFVSSDQASRVTALPVPLGGNPGSCSGGIVISRDAGVTLLAQSESSP